MPLRGAGEAYLSALRSAIRPFGVPIVCNAEVTALRKSGDAVTGVEGLLSGEPFRLTSRPVSCSRAAASLGTWR